MMRSRSMVVVASFVMAAIAGAGVAAADGISAVRERLTAAADASFQQLARDFEIVEAATGQVGQTTFEPAVGTSYFVYGACDDNCTNIDLDLADSNDSWFTEADRRPDATPVVMIPSSDSPRVIMISLDMVACATATCTMGIGIYSVEIE